MPWPSPPHLSFFSSTPVADSSTLVGAFQNFGALPHVSQNAEDSGDPRTFVPGAAEIAFKGWGRTTVPVINTFARSVEQDTNQCWPAAVANSLEYLKQRFDVPVRHDHVPGIADAPPNSRVGQIDLRMGRAAGQGVFRAPAILGKLQYLSDTRLGGALVVKHRGRFDDAAGNFLSGDISRAGVTSRSFGNRPTIDFIMSEIMRGEDVEFFESE